jgi:hypothetical protein
MRIEARKRKTSIQNLIDFIAAIGSLYDKRTYPSVLLQEIMEVAMERLKKIQKNDANFWHVFQTHINQPETLEFNAYSNLEQG